MRIPCDKQTNQQTDFANQLITKQAAIDAAECIVEHHSITPYKTMAAAMDHLKRILNGMPSAQPQLDKAVNDAYKHGKSKGIKKGLAMAKAQTPCDVCRFNPPSSTDGKPCTMCPAEPYKQPDKRTAEELSNDIRHMATGVGVSIKQTAIYTSAQR